MNFITQNRIFKPPLDMFGGITTNNFVWGYVLSDNCPCSNNSAIPDRYTAKNLYTCPYPYVMTYSNVSLLSAILKTCSYIMNRMGG